MFILGFTLGFTISVLLLAIYLIIENIVLKRDLLDAIENMGVKQEPISNRKLIGFIKPAKKKSTKK